MRLIIIGRLTMFHRTGTIVVALAIVLAASVGQSQDRRAGAKPKNVPPIKEPILFNTPEADAIVSAMQIFPKDNPWHADVSKWKRHPNSDKIVASIGTDKPLRYNIDMAYVFVPPSQKKAEVKIVEYPDESDKGPYPVPDNLPLEGWPAYYSRARADKKLSLDDVQRDKLGIGGDRQSIVVDPTAGRLYEFFGMKRTDEGWQAGCAAIFDLKTNKLRPDGWTSADAAGLPIFPAVIRYDEIKAGVIDHAMRVTVRNTQRAYVYPAAHFASQKTDPDLARMGERLRLTASVGVSGFAPPAQTLRKALKKHGVLGADNGVECAISCAPDERIPVLHDELRKVKGSA